jgi:hypothetical protein
MDCAINCQSNYRDQPTNLLARMHYRQQSAGEANRRIPELGSNPQ